MQLCLHYSPRSLLSCKNQTKQEEKAGYESTPKMSTTSNLQVSLATPTLSFTTDPPILQITASVHNTAEIPVTILKWNTPLDPRAGILGIFEFRDTESGEILSTDTIKISRKLPVSADDLIEINALESVEAHHTLTGLEVHKGRGYSVRARGIWHAVWANPVVDVTASQRQNLTGADSGEFLSEFVTFQVK